MLSPGKGCTASLANSFAKAVGPQGTLSLTYTPHRQHRQIHLSNSTASASAFPTTSRSIASASQSSDASSSRCSLSTKASRRFMTTTPGVRLVQRQRDYEKSASASQDIRLTPRDSRAVTDVQNWLERAFPGVRLPDEIAMMMITHESWDFGVSSGHNRRLSFLGRRAMKFYLSLFLAVHDKTGTILTNDRLDDLLMVWKLGDNVGRALRLEEVMRWTPAISDGQKGPRETGLFKIRGVAVEALLGAIYHQHGAQAAKAFFSSRVLPSLEGFTKKEAIELEAAIVSESRAGDATLLQMAKSQDVREREIASVDQAIDKIPATDADLQSSLPDTRQRAPKETLATKGTLRRRPQSLGSRTLPIDNGALQRGQTQDGTSLA